MIYCLIFTHPTVWCVQDGARRRGHVVAVEAAALAVHRCNAARRWPRASARPINRVTRSVGDRPESAQSFGYIEMAVNPGIVLIWLTSTWGARSFCLKSRGSNNPFSQNQLHE